MGEEGKIYNNLSLQLGNEEIFKDLFDNAHDLIHFAQPDGTLLYVNNAWLHTLQYSRVEVEQASIYSFVEAKDIKRFTAYREQVISGSSNSSQITITLITKAGNRIILEGSVSARFEGGQALYTRGIFRDVTERVVHEQELQRINQQLRESEESLRQLIAAAPDAVIVIDAQSRITLWNPKAEQLFGWKANEVTGTPLADKIIPVQYRQAHQEGMQRYLATGKAHVLGKTIDITAINKQGEEFYISLTISSAALDGKTAFISFIRDITSEKQNELELGRKQQQLEASNKELEQFAYAASHDMQEPLRKIQTFSDLLIHAEYEKLSEKGKSYLTKINSSAERMKGIINDLLNYSQQTSQQGQFVETDLNEIVNNVKADLEVVIKKKGALVTSGVLPKIKAIPAQINQLFYNLISNALKFSKPDVAPVITIEWQNAGEEGEQHPPGLTEPLHFIEIVIADNGIGFRQEYADLIFKMFQRLNDKHTYEGTGIGLALCKKVVQNHGGHIWAASEPGKGAAFYIHLPAAPATP